MKNYILFIVISIILFFGCSDSKKPITKLSDVTNISIGSMTGTTGEQLAKKRFPESTIKSFDDIMDAAAALKSNQIEAVIISYPAATHICRVNQDLQLLSEPVALENTAIAVKKGNPELLAKLNEIIDEFRNDGTLKDMKRRWLKTDSSAYEEIQFQLPKNGEVLKIGTSATREPFCFIDASRKVSGHDGELARRISIKLNRPIEFSDMKFSALIPALASGKVDIILAGMTATDERRKSVDFTDSYFDNAQVLIVKKAIQPKEELKESEELKLKTADDLNNKQIGVLLGSIHDNYAIRRFPNSKILHYKSPAELIHAVRAEKIAGALFTTENLLEIIRLDNKLAILGDTLFTVPVGIGFNQKNDELREKFNNFLKQIKKNGVYDDMVDRWIKKGSSELPEIKNPKNNGKLIVGLVSDKGLPFCIMKDNKIIGFDVEIAERFAASLGKELILSDMEFSNLIASLSTNKIQMISSTLMVTEERKKQIDFSDEYLRLGASIVVLKKNLFEAVDNKNQSTSKSFLTSIYESFYSNIILENRYLLILDGLKTTGIISIFSILFGTLFGGLICFMRMSRKNILSIPAKAYIAVLRGTPVLVVLMIIFYVVFASIDIDPALVAVFAFGLNFAAYVSEMFRAGIEGVDKGQQEAGIALGFSKIKTFIYIILPQAVKLILPVYKGEVISLVKMTSIVGYIAVHDLTKASDIIRSRTFDAFFPLFMVAFLYFFIAWLLMLILGYFERATDPKFKMKRR